MKQFTISSRLLLLLGAFGLTMALTVVGFSLLLRYSIARSTTVTQQSTAQQGRSGLGLEAQANAVREYLNGGKWTLAASFTEVECGKNNDRP